MLQLNYAACTKSSSCINHANWLVIYDQISKRARISSADWERFHTGNTSHIKHDREDKAFHKKEKFDSIEFSRFTLQYFQSAVTLLNEVKCCYCCKIGCLM